MLGAFVERVDEDEEKGDEKNPAKVVIQIDFDEAVVARSDKVHQIVPSSFGGIGIDPAKEMVADRPVLLVQLAG